MAGARLRWLPLASLLVAAALCAQARGAANVTLESITVHGLSGWSFYPKVYFSCAGGNRTDLSFVKQVMHLYHAQANETWQPLTVLAPRACQKCGVYERGWFSDSTLGEWTVCTSNFSAGADGLLTLIKENQVSVNIACPQCALEDVAAPSPLDSRASPGGDPLIAMLFVCGAFAALGSIVAIVVFQNTAPVVIESEEQVSLLAEADEETGLRSPRPMVHPSRKSNKSKETYSNVGTYGPL